MALNDPPPRHATPALAGRLSALGLVLSLLLQGCGQQKGLCEKGDATCKELQALQQSLGSCNELHPDSRFVGNPKITDISGTCAAVEFLYASQQMPVVYLYGRVARDADFTAEWGEGLHPLELEGESPEMAELKGKLPPELKCWQQQSACEEDAAFEGSAFSCSSEPEVTLPKKLHPAAPYEEGSVCVDLHWSHPFPQLKLVPEDAYFRVWMQYEGEPKKQFCEDARRPTPPSRTTRVFTRTKTRVERRGQMSLPIQKKNHTHSRDAALLHDYLQRYHVHQEQEVLVATRSKDEFLESPVSAFSLGDWLIMEKYVKCLTSFNAQQPSYVSSAVQLSWTEEQSMRLYD
eukprot:g18574.t1